MDKPILLWFRQDLRLQDHPALEAALQMKRKVIPLFIGSTEVSGFASIGAASKVWLHESLKSLDAQLQNRGSKLLFRTGRPIEVLKELVEQTGATTLLWGRQYEPDSILRDTEIKQFFRAKGLTVHSFNTNLIVEPWKLKTQSGTPYRVFTPFWRACERVACEEMALQASSVPEEIPGPQNWPSGCFLNELGLIPQGQLDHNGESWHEVILKNWQPGEPGAQLQLQKFLHQSLQGYQKDRDLPSLSGSSRLSPHLHFGEISPKRLFQEILAASELTTSSHLLADAETFLKELGWREFAYHLLYHEPQTISHPLKKEFVQFSPRVDPALFHAWKKGLTGYPLVDAGMRELWQTGFMHNRVRMIAASFLIKHLLIPWQIGAQYFWETLLDADLASNTMGWQWVAGCGADASPFFRIFNPVLQSKKFDPDGTYIRTYIPELRSLSNEFIHEPWKAPQAVLDYPAPIVDHAFARELALEAYRAIKNNN